MSKPFKFRNAWWIRFTDEFGKRRKRVFDDYSEAVHALTAHWRRPHGDPLAAVSEIHHRLLRPG